MRHTIAAVLGAIAIALVFFVLGHTVWPPAPHPTPFPSMAPSPTHSPPPPDGNPIGFHFHGAAKIDRLGLDLKKCANHPCTLNFDFVIAKTGHPDPAARHCPSRNCLHFHSSKTMYVSSRDDAMSHPEETVSADGIVQGP